MRFIQYPLADPDPLPDGLDGRTRAMFAAMARATAGELWDERPEPVDAAFRHELVQEDD